MEDSPAIAIVKAAVAPEAWAAAQAEIDAQIAKQYEAGLQKNSWSVLWSGMLRSKAMGLSLVGAVVAAWGIYSDQIIPVIQAQVDPKMWPIVLLAFSFLGAVIRTMTNQSLEEKGTKQ